MTPGARSIIEEVAARHGGMDVKLLTGRCRVQRVFRARIEVAKLLDSIGYTSPRIAALLNKDHTTILYYLGRGRRRPGLIRWRPPKVRHLCFIRAKKPPRPRYYLTPYAGADWREYQWKERPNP